MKEGQIPKDNCVHSTNQRKIKEIQIVNILSSFILAISINKSIMTLLGFI